MKTCITCKKIKEDSLFSKGRNQCKECRNASRKCIHNKSKYTCKECNPISNEQIEKIKIETKKCNICNEIKTLDQFGVKHNQCNKCKYIKSLCIHKKEKKKCKECGGTSICEHNKIKTRCKECKGGSICPHNKIKSNCKECGGSQICEHGRIKCRCTLCGGSSICEHNKIQINCVECGGSQICEHDKLKHNCVECEGSQICTHSKIKKHCITCNPSIKCEHDKFKQACIICNPNVACRDCKEIYVDKSTHCYPLCEGCFSFKFPNHPKVIRYKIKERYLVDELKTRLTEHKVQMLCDKIIEGGCSSRRPDVLIDCLTHSIIIECDENQHKNYECENKRLMQLFLDLGNRPLIMIRFNPDNYKDKNNKIVKSCFQPLKDKEQLNAKRFYDINKKEWLRRISILEFEIKKYLTLNTFPDKEITEIKYFFDKYD